MRAVVHGVGATGARVARFLASSPVVERVTIIDTDHSVAGAVAESLGKKAEVVSIDALRTETRASRFGSVCESGAVVVLAANADHGALARAALEAGSHVVSISDDVEVVRNLQGLDEVALRADRSLVIGAGFSPGLTCLLAAHAARRLDVVDEVHVAKFGTGGPECARQHHRALRSEAVDWQNRQWENRRGGSGRELCWFPDPIGGLDCYQAALPDAALLLPAFPELVRATARVSATRRDRLTKWLPMLRSPHPEGLIGAVRVEVRGWSGSVRSSVILGVLDRPAVAAAAVAATVATRAFHGDLSMVGSGGVAQMVTDTSGLLRDLALLGVKAATFEGTSTAA